ncbi:KGGVGR-motif variant AAA ATPase [Melittangium boletus]|uniref:CobQ/CobB/MinD/ParA nucleotide binding domain-containing protein n=1 Tax=Melittangium boletus DSM 14713 TaxID=1294270 RepID=A0A250IEZ8_9BACT|nr:AAA family ATPase [Melittangium boletus]ATB29800.1 hypothetical protein MEBOL_003255 [Melittangium boletus DSM 14713]
MTFDANVFFDDSLPRLVETVAAELGDEGLAAGVVLRDASGRLAFFAGYPLDAERSQRLATRLLGELRAYARTDRVLVGPSDFGAKEILEDSSVLQCRVGQRTVRLADRRLVGADWLRKPAELAPPPPRFVFASLKGGVGRSTSLSVVAAHLAARGGRVLAVDLDLEAPGLGALLLTRDILPEFGTIDALVENNLHELNDSFLSDLIGPSSLASRGGRIDVVPAFGRRSLDNPGDILGKLARAYAEDIRPDGSVATILDQVRDLIDRLASAGGYDAILVDARAGLHETTASAVLGLGADVLLFGLHEEQTFQGYTALLAHLARLVPPGSLVPEWVERLTPVQAKAPVDAIARSEFNQRWQSMVREHGPLATAWVAPREVQIPEGFRDVPWNEQVPDEEVLPPEWSLLEPIAVLRDDRFERFDPLRRRDLLSEEVYRSTFGAILERVEGAVFPKNEVSS